MTCTGLVKAGQGWSRNVASFGSLKRSSGRATACNRVQLSGSGQSFVGMMLAASNAKLKATLRDKTRWRPTRMVMEKMPDGTADLAELPHRKADAVEGDIEADEASTARRSRACTCVASTFGRQRRSVSTAAEHVMYMRMFDGWLVENKLGSVVEAVSTMSASDVVGAPSWAASSWSRAGELTATSAR